MDKPKLGRHWILDAYDCDPRSLKDPALFRELLIELPTAMKMTRVNEPQIYESETTIAGLVLIAESHISLHASLVTSQLHADVFSCRVFDSKITRDLLQTRFGFQRYEENQLDR